MKIYKREIKPYIQPPCLQGCNASPYPVDGYDWVSEDLERQLRKEIIVNDSWSQLIFKERYVVVGDGIVGEWEGIPIKTRSLQETLNNLKPISHENIERALKQMETADDIVGCTIKWLIENQ